jgi:hypothetical protein
MLDEAVKIARAQGVQIPEDVTFFLDPALPTNTFAQYFARVSNYGDRVHWSEFFNKFGKIPVKIAQVVLQSDEAIVAVLAHECYEIERLRAIFSASGGSITAEVLEDLIGIGRIGNLHDRAWDVADQAVLKMRSDDDI